MASIPSKSKPQENSWLWLIKAVTGIFVLIILMVHYIVNHITAPQGLLTYADVVKYYQHPFIPVMEIGFLVFVVSHALIGLRGVVLDLHPSPALVRVLNWLFSIAGIGAIAIGSFIIITIASRGVA